MDDKYVYIWVKVCNIRVGRWRLRLEKRIAYDCKDKVWRSV